MWISGGYQVDIMWISCGYHVDRGGCQVDRGGCQVDVRWFNSMVIMLISCSDAVAQYQVPMNTKMTVRGVMLDLEL